MKKLLVRILIVLLVLVIVLYLGRNIIARKSVEVAVTKLTGFPLTIGAVDVGLLQSRLDVREIQLANPPEFEEKLFVHLPQVYVDYQLGSMIARSPHINQMILNLDKVIIVKNKQGVSNVAKLKAVGSSSGGGGGGGAGAAGQPAAAPEKKAPYRVDELKLHIGTVVYKDYSGSKPTERTMPLNIDATYKNITDSTDITRLVLVTMLGKVHLPDIGVNMDQLTKGLGNVTDAAGTAIKGAADTLNKAGQSIFDTFKGATGGK